MQYLMIDKNETMLSVSKVVGQQNVDALLAENGIERTPNIGKAWKNQCNNIIDNAPDDVSADRKATLLNRLTSSEEVFEKACLMDESEWKVFSAKQAFTDAIRVPESIKLPFSSKVIGDTLGDVVTAAIGNVASSRSTAASSSSIGSMNYDPVDPVTYRAVMKELEDTGRIDPGVFNTVNTSPAVKLDNVVTIERKAPQYSYNLPWGKIQMYSTLLSEFVDFPAYPEQVDTARVATYTSMPDVIYQYEPWIVYQNSGPREQSLSFHLHRDLWSGNHLDGQANNLIRFCEANTFPKFSGSAVLAPLVRLYIDGSLFIAGVLTATNVSWSGPLGLDNWYLEFTLSLSIQEISEQELNIDTVRKFGLIG